MIDPVSAAGLATESICILVKVISALKRFAEAVKEARKDLISLLHHTEGVKNMFQLLNIALLELRKTAFHDMELAIDTSRCKETLKKLQALAAEVINKKATLGIIEKLNWATKKQKAKALCGEMAEQEKEIINVLMVVNSASTFRTQKQVQDLTATTRRLSELQDAFAHLSVQSGTLQIQETETTASPALRTWLGQAVVENVPACYVSLRSRLSDAAFWGQWDTLFDILREAREKYQESWVNATRMKPRAQCDQLSLWTPLHQAAYNRAPVEVVRKLIQLGASRTLRSRWSQYSYTDMTSLELAHEFQAEELYDVLSATIHRPVPSHVLNVLQEEFHSLIRRDLGDLVAGERINLPILEGLTELKDEVLWFPIRYRDSYAGYLYQLDGRDVVVKSFNVRGNNEESTYRITAEGVFEIDEALVFNG